MNPIKNILFTLASGALFLFTGCNSDIFISEPPLIDEVMTATIDGDGGVAEFHIPEEALELISLNQVTSLEVFCTYYNAKGDIIDRKSPASQISKIEFESDFYKFDIEKKNGIITVKSICNASGYDALRTIVLQYSYGYRYIDVNMLHGDDVKLVRTIYSDSLDITERTVSRRYHFFNERYVPVVDSVQPYLNEHASLFVDPDRSSTWVCENSYSIDVPVFEDGNWIIKNMPDITPGYSYIYEGPDQEEYAFIELPYKSITTISVNLVLSQYVGHGQMIFLNEILNREIEIPFDVISIYPTRYEIRYDEIQNMYNF